MVENFIKMKKNVFQKIWSYGFLYFKYELYYNFLMIIWKVEDFEGKKIFRDCYFFYM